MKYLKRYTEATVYISDSDIKSLVYDKLRDLDDLESGFHYFIQNYLYSEFRNNEQLERIETFTGVSVSLFINFSIYNRYIKAFFIIF